MPTATAQRIRTYREAKGWKQADLARELSIVKGKTVSRESVSQWEGGEYPGPPNVRALAAVFGKPAWEFQRFSGDTARLSDATDRHLIPLLRMCQLKLLGPGGMLKNTGKRPIKQLEVSDSTPKHAFAIVIEDMSMADRFWPGEEVVIDPNLPPKHKPDDPDFVLARIDKSSQFVFREYRPRGPEAFDLVGYHKDCKTISVTADDPILLLGTMTEHRRKRRAR